MKDKGHFGDIEVKKANIIHHHVEANIFESAHPEGSSIYEKSEVSKSITFIVSKSANLRLCVDVGCGTGFVTSFEVPFYKIVVAADISRSMIKVARARLNFSNSINWLVCDAEFLPLKNEVADLVSISSVLHHCPKPFTSMMEISRILRHGGFFYVTREPNLRRLRRFFDFFDNVIVKRLVKLGKRINFPSFGFNESKLRAEGLLYSQVDIHYAAGFDIERLSRFLSSKGLEIISAYSYHWIFSDLGSSLLQLLLTKSNFVIEKIPFSKKFGRFLEIIARKT